MNHKKDYDKIMQVMAQQGIHKLYHFTDFDNLASIIAHGGLYSWADCEDKGIAISKPGGSSQSRDLDRRGHLEHYVRLSFTDQHPMMYVAMKEGRITNPVLLEIDVEAAGWADTLYADRNATRSGAQIGGSLDDLNNIHFNAVRAKKHFDLDEDEQPFFQAEVMVKNHVPLSAIKNIGNFSIALPSAPMQSKNQYTAQITRNTPTAFIFMIDQSVSMDRTTRYNGEEMTLSEAAARILNHQINELVLRCIKSNEVRHYFDIAVIGYGHEVYSGWQSTLEGRDFVSPKELMDNPYKKIIIREEIKTRSGIKTKEVEKVQWIEARHDGRWTHLHKAFDRVKELLEDWMQRHHEQDCYPPTIINITDGQFNGSTNDHVLQQANELKSMFTNDGNVLLFNIHIVPTREGTQVVFPVGKQDLNGNAYAELLFDMSSLLPPRYNEEIARQLDDHRSERHAAMGVNADTSALLKLIDIGTQTNITSAQ